MPNDQSVTGSQPSERTGPVPVLAPEEVASWATTDGAEGTTCKVHHGDHGPDRLEPSTAETIFEIMVALMWSDGALTTPEVERGHAAARVMRVRPRQSGALGAIAEGALPFSQLDFGALDATHRQLAYAAAAWVDQGSAHPSNRRTGFMRALQLRLGLGEEVDDLCALASTVNREHDDLETAFGALVLALVANDRSAPCLD